MPLVRIDLIAGTPAAYRRAIGDVVYDALVGRGVPEDDRFQVITDRQPDDFIVTDSYLGLRRSADTVLIQITLNQGRTVETKRALYRAIANGLHDAIGLRVDDVFINLVEVPKENWSFGNGDAPYADLTIEQGARPIVGRSGHRRGQAEFWTDREAEPTERNNSVVIIDESKMRRAVAVDRTAKKTGPSVQGRRFRLPTVAVQRAPRAGGDRSRSDGNSFAPAPSR